MDTIRGKLIRLANLTPGLPYGGNIQNETSCTLTITEGMLQGAGTDERGSLQHGTRRQWNVAGSCYLTPIELYNLIFCMRNSNVATSLAFYGTHAGRSIILYGQAVITSASFIAQGRQLVRMQFTALGSGAPTVAYEL